MRDRAPENTLVWIVGVIFVVTAAIWLLFGCLSEDQMKPDEFSVQVSRADLNHDNDVFDGEQTRVGMGFTWYTSGDRDAAYAAMARSDVQMEQLIELAEELPPPPPSEEDGDIPAWAWMTMIGGAAGGGGLIGRRTGRE